MKYIIFLSLLFWNCGCANSPEKVKVTYGSCNALGFLMSKNYIFSTSKEKIPGIIIDSLGHINHEVFGIGDNTDTNKISLSDAILNDYKYKRKLHFLLVNDTLCLITYTEGGVGSHDIVDYVRYKGQFEHSRYTTTDILDDTIKLRSYLTKIGLKPCPSPYLH